jgi:hypothetical protein
MSSKTDNDNLEDFFRKATSHHRPDFNEGDWVKMERRLDDHFGKPTVASVKRFKIISAVVLLLATLGAVTVILLRPETGRQEVPAANAPVAPEAETPMAIKTPENQAERQAAEGTGGDSGQRDQVAQEAATNPVKADGAAGKALLNRRSAIDTAPVGSVSQGTLHDRETGSIIPPVPSFDTREGEDEDFSEPANIVIRSETDLGFNQLQADPQEEVAGLEKERVRSSGTERVMEDQVVDSASAVPTVDALAGLSETAEEKKKSGILNGRWSVSFMAAPDFSTTASKGMTSPGDAVGVMIHYQVFERWGISAGVLNNTKKYWGKGNEYHPPKGYWNALTNGVVPERIDGNCVVIEVPVTVTFDIVQTRRSRLFASAGLSSYRMQNEDYYYQFESPNPGAVTGWSGSSPSSLWFGIGSLSIGYDFKVSRSLSFGVEPYYKIPFEGVGWAEVDLYSTGVLFAARYHFLRKDKHPPPSQGP